MTSANLTTDGQTIYETPLTSYRIEFTMDGKTYVVTGDDTARHIPEDEQAAAFMGFCEELTEWLKTERNTSPSPKRKAITDKETESRKGFRFFTEG